MGGLGVTELLFIAVTIALLFGPGAVLVWWFMSHQRASADAPPPVEPRAAEQAPGTTEQVPMDPALEAARERFARGEITAEEYEEIKRVLEA